MPKIILLSNSKSITFPLGSKLSTLTHRDPLPIKIHKYLLNLDIKSILVNEENYTNIDLENEGKIIVFKDAMVEDEEIISFCSKNNFSLLNLKEEFKINGSYDFKIIHSPLLYTFEDIANKISQI